MASGERDTAVERLPIPIIAIAGHGCGQNPAFSGLCPPPERPDLPRIMPWRASVHRFEPDTRSSPVAAVIALKKLNLARVFNDYDFGGYLIASGDNAWCRTGG
jgi:hypothetical protein